MRCPICGAKMLNKQLCPYCKIVDKQVYGASNKKVKECRKNDNKDLICYTNVIPSDVSKVALWLFTYFLGWCGVNHFIIHRPVRAWFSVLSTVCSITIMFFYLFFVPSTLFGEWVIYILYNGFFICMALNVVMWFFDMIALIFKGFKIPVVLPDKGDVK
ncbi:MAG: hypothetical protein E7354_04965 [Clostridiales bacterium]|nr:hypothetical protein [Clostridiales bacterium]